MRSFVDQALTIPQKKSLDNHWRGGRNQKNPAMLPRRGGLTQLNGQMAVGDQNDLLKPTAVRLTAEPEAVMLVL
jgi:hypothetical protein